MDTQGELWHDTLPDALRHTISALGGPKRVGCDMWPHKSAQQASTQISNCLSEGRPEKLDLEELIFILKRARAEGVHTAMTFILRECGYADPQPVEPEDERAALEREFIQSVEVQRKLMERLERLSASANVAQIRRARSEKSV